MAEDPAIAATIRAIPQLGVRVSGIALTRIVAQALAEQGVTTRVVACDLYIGNNAARTGAPGSASAQRDLGLGPESRGKHRDWRGHLIIAGEWFTADVMVDAYHNPVQGIIIPGALLSSEPVDLDDGAIARVDLPKGGVVMYRLHPDVVRFRHTPEWQSAPLSLVPRLVEAAQ